MRLPTLLLTAFLLVSACGKGEAMPSDVVTTDTGRVRGEVRDSHLVFQGIPYARASRWEPPVRAASWDGVRDALAPGSPCPQVGSGYSETKSTNEDCLFANVMTPSTSGRRPVLVWIHGDGAIGAGHHFHAERLARQGDVVVVTFNYRMGVFGGFGLPGLPHSGEFGLLDQRAALEWVRRNVSGFGGDPGNVTLFGVSFGATAVSAHLIAQKSARQPLFHKAILHSSFTLVDVPKGAWFPDLEALPSLAWRPVAEIEEIGAAITGELGCADLACLRALPAATLLEHPQIMNIFQPVGYGGSVLPEPPAQSLETGAFSPVPMLAGATRDEHNSFVGLFRPDPMSADDYSRLVREAFPERAAEVEREYPVSAYASAKQAWAALLTDRVWARATFRQNTLYARHAPVYAFEFADRGAATDPSFPTELHGANHSSDIDYLFPDRDFAKDRGLSDHMIRTWTDFARTGTPGWPRFSAGQYVQSLAPGAIGPVDYAAEHRLAFWD
ncbi:para-nitrobenzyl esterase [Lentzea xinjiangensis]|uniref:Para-nitrobenzyl esterase n=1 Tax=Lentzea xinjiangensis TaxID=402600 RepID=A0A1H9L2P8_9PSEU|nr:carboxylesterase family protein [Lentzea xinjiangensis]SER05293.1 para-nitrobenzyl esterase [Lentzea xinjiangensis]